jgi:hypothetical protein
MESQIIISEKVDNKDRRFGQNKTYYPAIIIDQDGFKSNALFTGDQIQVAKERADSNPEDLPKENKSFWDYLFGG